MYLKGFLVIFGLLFSTATLALVSTFTWASSASQPLANLQNLDVKPQILLSPSPGSIDILSHINSSRYELQKSNTTGALAELDIATQQVSRVTQTLWVIHMELLRVAQEVKGQIPGSNDISHGNYFLNGNQAGMEHGGYNALVNFILARQDILNGNLKGAQTELDGAAQAIIQFSKILTSTGLKLDSINSAWSFNASPTP
jgi:hypothetical protein